MKRISVKTGRSYEVVIGKSILAEIGAMSLEIFAPCKLCLITDKRVDLLYGDAVRHSLTNAGFDVHTFSFFPGEESKSLTTYGECLEFLAEKNFSRSDGIVALGGGIVGDVAGFVAGTYLRGVDYIQIPTTFLAAIDSSVGGKTGINLSHGKNLAGAFWQPRLVVCDPDTFKTLSTDVFLDGVAEAIKYGILSDRSLFDQIAAAAPITSSYSRLEEIIAICVRIKASLVEKDEKDTGIRQLLNLGHTVGHAIEKCSGYSISHGHAVATGIVIITKASKSFGYTDGETLSLINDVIEKHGFSMSTPYTYEELIQVILHDKKRGGSNINLILPTKIGASEIREFPVNSLEGFIKAGLR